MLHLFIDIIINAILIYAELKLHEDSVTVSFTEKAFPEKHQLLEKAALKMGDGSFILHKEGKLAKAMVKNRSIG